jgi:hypothetical protein
MKLLFPSLLTASALLLATGAHAQDKPALNTAPPGSRPAPAPTQPAPTQQPAPTTPAPAPEPTPPAPEAPVQEAPPVNAPRPTSDNPSGLDFPGRTKSTSGLGGPPLTAKKMFVYTNFGLGFNSFNGVTSFNISAAPALGYRLTERFAAGPGISYAYQSFSIDKSLNVTFPSGERTISTNSVGFKAFAQFIVYKQFFVHGEYEITNAELIDERDFSVIKRTITTPLLGAGYRTEFSSNAAADIVVLYNFNDGVYSGFYGQPVIRFSFLFNIGRPTADR